MREDFGNFSERQSSLVLRPKICAQHEQEELRVRYSGGYLPHWTLRNNRVFWAALSILVVHRFLQVSRGSWGTVEPRLKESSLPTAFFWFVSWFWWLAQNLASWFHPINCDLLERFFPALDAGCIFALWLVRSIFNFSCDSLIPELKEKEAELSNSFSVLIFCILVSNMKRNNLEALSWRLWRVVFRNPTQLCSRWILGLPFASFHGMILFRDIFRSVGVR